MTRPERNGSYKQILIAVLGTVLGLVFLYYAFRGVSWNDLIDGMAKMNVVYFIPAFFTYLLLQFLRAVRFGIILNPVARLGLKDLWDLTNIWGGLNMLMPARLAEFVRPYLLRSSHVPFSSTFGAVMVERFFDLLALLSLLAVILWASPHTPERYAVIGKVMLGALSFSYAAVLLTLWRRDVFQTIVGRVLRVLPEKAASFVDGIVSKLLDGLTIMANPVHSLLIFGCSLGIWIIFSGLVFIFLTAFSIDVPFLAAVFIQVAICFGVALPSAPGFIGVFHAACRLALAVFGVAAVPAVSFATVYHLFAFVMSLGLAVVSYYTGRFRLEQGLYPYTTEPDEETEPSPRETIRSSESSP